MFYVHIYTIIVNNRIINEQRHVNIGEISFEVMWFGTFGFY